MSDLNKVIQDLYDSEINASISWFWDGGFDVALGDDLNGFVEERCCDTWAEAVRWLVVGAMKHYPNSDFATKYSARQKDPVQ